MEIPDEVRKCVVFIGYKHPDGRVYLAGTGFFLGTPRNDLGVSFSYLVTAKHVIDKIRDKLCDTVLLRVNFKNGDAQWVETGIDNWLTHPTDSEVDIAVRRLAPHDNWDHMLIDIGMVLTDEIQQVNRIGAVREVFLVGLFARHHGQKRNIPIVRVGNIAAMLEEKVETEYGLMDAYLVEARSIGGISGSPVFVSVPWFRMENVEQGVTMSHATAFFLLGLMHGHFDITHGSDVDVDIEDAASSRTVNMGIAIVPPVSRILEVINQPMIKKKEKQEIEELRKKRLPKADAADIEVPFTRDAVEQTLKKVSRKVSESDSDKK